MSSTILIKHKKSNENSLLLDKERQLEDSAIDCDIEFHGRLKKLYVEWSKNIKEQHKVGLYPRPLCTISSYIKARLRARGASIWAIKHVSRYLDSEFKLEKYDSTRDEYDNGIDDMTLSLAIRDPNGSNITSDMNPRNRIFLDFEQTAKSILNNVDIFELLNESVTECEGVIARKVQELYELKKRIKKELTNYKDFADSYSMSIFPETKSVELPPEHFRGKSELWKNMDRLYSIWCMVGNHIKGVRDKIYIYKPNRQTDLRALEHLEKWFNDVVNPLITMLTFALDAIDHTIDDHDNGKIAASLPHWLKMGYDDIVNTGTRGSGVVNAILTGQRVVKLGKDGKSVITVDIKRPFTKEDIGEQGAAKLLKKALDICIKDELVQAFKTWTDHSDRKVRIMELDQYYRKKMNIPQDVDIEIITKKVPYLPVEDKGKEEDKGAAPQ